MPAVCISPSVQIPSQWTPVNQFLPTKHTQLIHSWLSDPSSLTIKLEHITARRIIHILRTHGWQQPLPEEFNVLTPTQQAQKVWVREIEWRYQRYLWVIGRVLIPSTTWAIYGNEFQRHPQQPIGYTLFKTTEHQRQTIDIIYLSPEHNYYKQLTPYLSAIAPKGLWARRSLFSFCQHPLWVIEMFLPEFFEAPPVRQTANQPI